VLIKFTLRNKFKRNIFGFTLILQKRGFRFDIEYLECERRMKNKFKGEYIL